VQVERFRTPENIASLVTRINRRKPENRCIHCHDVKQALLDDLRTAGQFDRSLIFTYPQPSALGLDVDLDDQTRIRGVRPSSPAAAADVRAGDRLTRLAGQRLLTAADLSHVLERTPRDADLPLELVRNGEKVRTTLRLSGDWRKSADPSWRSSTYVAGPNGGFWAVPLDAKAKGQLGIAADGLALRVNVFFGGRQEPGRSGLKVGDVIVEFDGKRQAMTTRQMHTHLQMNRNYGDKVPLVVRRGGNDVRLELHLPAGAARLE
jgi:S1-C subfamily serine protease